MKRACLLLALLTATPAVADTVIAVTPIRSQTILTPAHLGIISREVVGGVSDPSQLVGLETRVNLYPNRPIMMHDVGAPRVVDRNDLVTLTFAQSGLTISVEGRALGAAGLGESVRVMNLASRTVVVGQVDGPGNVSVGAAE